jgi:5-formyltetrahydrofolate cyclo-ligase
MPERKAELRARLRAARRSRDATALADAGAALARHAAALPGPTVAAFVGVRSEPPTLPLLDALRVRGVRVLLPVLEPDLDLDWADYTGGDGLADGHRGMREPAGARLGHEGIALADLVLAPALAVDAAGRRLGQGGGSYDRALPRARARVLAVVFDDELIGEVPTEPHDRRVAGVLTPVQGVRWFAECPTGHGR